MNMCVKTGANVWVGSYQCLLRCDAYLVCDPTDNENHGCYVFRYTGDALDQAIVGKGKKADANFILMDTSIHAQQHILHLENAQCFIAPWSDVLEINLD